jgi:hypothetical protein
MDASSQDSVTSSTTGGMTGLLRTALMKGRQESASHPPSQMSTASSLGPSSQPSVPPSPLTAQFSSLSTSSHHASPVPFTQGASMSRQSSHQVSPVPFTQGHSRFGASPMESLVSMATNQPPKNDEGEKLGQESERLTSGSGSKFGSFNIPGYSSMSTDYQSQSYVGSSQRLPTTTTNSFVEPKHSSQLSSTSMPKKLTDPYEMPRPSTELDSGFSMADLLRNKNHGSSESSMNERLKPGMDKSLEDYDSNDSSGMSEPFPEIDFDTPMPGVEQPLLPSEPGRFGMGTKISQASRLPAIPRIQRTVFDVNSGRDKGNSPNVSAVPIRKDESRMSSLGSLLCDPGSGNRGMEDSTGPPLSIADYQRAISTGTKPTAGGSTNRKEESRMSSLGSFLDDEETDSMDESGPPLSIADYQRALSRTASNTGTKPISSGDISRKDETSKMSSLGSLLDDRSPGSETMEDSGPPLSIADYQRALTQKAGNIATKPTVGPNYNRMQDTRLSALGSQHHDEDESMDESGPPLSIADYQRALARTAADKGTKPAVDGDTNRKESRTPSLGSLLADRSPGPGMMEESPGPPLTIADYQRALTHRPSDIGTKPTVGGEQKRKQESGMSSLGSVLGTPSPGSESMDESGPPLSIADYQRALSQTAGSTGTKPTVVTDPNRKQKHVTSSLASLLGTKSPDSEDTEESGPPLSIADYQRALARTSGETGSKSSVGADQNRKPESGMLSLLGSPSSVTGIMGMERALARTSGEAGSKPSVGADQNRKPEPVMSLGSVLGSPSSVGGPMGMDDSGPPRCVPDYQRSLSRSSSEMGTKTPTEADLSKNDRTGMSSLVNPSQGPGNMEDSGPPLSIADYQHVLNRTIDTSQMNRFSDNIRPPGPAQTFKNTSTAAAQADIPLAVPKPKTANKRGPKPKSGTTRKKTGKNAPGKSQSAFGGQMGVTGNKQSPNISQAPMSMGIRHPYMGSQSGLSRSLSDSAQVGANFGRAGLRPVGSEPGSFGFEGSLRQSDMKDNYGERMNMPTVSHSPSLDRMFDSDSSSGHDQNRGLMMEFLGKKTNSPLDQDSRGSSLGSGIMPPSSIGTHLGTSMTRGNLDTAVHSPMDIGNARNYSNSRQENYDLMQGLYQNDSLSKSSDLFPGEEMMRPNELADFLSKGSMISGNSDRRPPDDLSGICSSSSMTMATTCSSMSMSVGSSMVHDSSGRLSSMLGEDSRNRLPAIGAESSGRVSGFVGGSESGNSRLSDSSGRIPSSGTGGNTGGRSGLGVGLGQGTDSSRRLPGMGESSGRRPGMADSSGRLPGMGESSGRHPGMADSSGMLSGMSESSGRHPGIADSSGRLSGTGEASGRHPGMADSSGRLSGTGESSGRHPGMADSSGTGRLSGMQIPVVLVGCLE